MSGAMMLHGVSNLLAQGRWAKAVMCSVRNTDSLFVRWSLTLSATLILLVVAFGILPSQQKKMVIDGTIRMGGSALPSSAKIRILHSDGSIARTVVPYDPKNNRFGIRLSSLDDFVENERILFRVVVAPGDSFLARTVGLPLLFSGTPVTTAAPVIYVTLFRNQLPSIKRTLPDTMIDENQLLRYRLVATDRDADTVRYRIKRGPQGCSIDPINGMFSWRPTFDQAGEYSLVFLVSDGHDEDSSRATKLIVRNVNRRPQIVRDFRDSTIREEDTLRFTVHATDPDGDHVTYRPLHVPQGMSIDAETGLVQWIPSYDQAGTYSIQFVASDGSALDSSGIVLLKVLNMNRPPRFTSSFADTTIRETQQFTYTFNAVDPDRDSVHFGLNAGPPGLTVSFQGLLSWKPSYLQAGDYSVTVSVWDQDTSVRTVCNIHVLNTDRPPLPISLYAPFDKDTISLSLPKPIVFSWYKSIDEDIDDTLRYKIHLWGPKLDTILGNFADTMFRANVKSHLQPTSKYSWTVIVNDGTMDVPSTETFTFRTSVAITGSTELLSQTPRSYYLEQNLPDPFNPIATIRYALPERSYVKLTIYNVLGEPLLELVSGEKEAGVYDVTFDSSEFASGAYMFRLDAHSLQGNLSKAYVNTKKMFIVR